MFIENVTTEIKKYRINKNVKAGIPGNTYQLFFPIHTTSLEAVVQFKENIIILFKRIQKIYEVYINLLSFLNTITNENYINSEYSIVNYDTRDLNYLKDLIYKVSDNINNIFIEVESIRIYSNKTKNEINVNDKPFFPVKNIYINGLTNISLSILINKISEYNTYIENQKTKNESVFKLITPLTTKISNFEKEYTAENIEKIPIINILNDPENIAQNYIFLALLKKYILFNSCENRKKEGYWINSSLKEMRLAIQYIVQSKDFNIFYNYIDSCIKEEEYKPDNIPLLNIQKFKNTLESNAFLTNMYTHLKYNNITDMAKRMVIGVYCVFNYTSSLNDPPTSPYYNIDILNKVTEENISTSMPTNSDLKKRMNVLSNSKT
jgi:hypothetical protein